MIGHQAPGEDLTHWFNKSMTFFEKVIIIIIVKKNRLPVVTPVVNVVNARFTKIHCW